LKKDYKKKGNSCRKQVEPSGKRDFHPTSSSDEVFQMDSVCSLESNEFLRALNRSFLPLSKSTLEKKRLHERKYLREQFEKAIKVFRSRLLQIDFDRDESGVPFSPGDEVIPEIPCSFYGVSFHYKTKSHLLLQRRSCLTV
jgi:hypothetical protein